VVFDHQSGNMVAAQTTNKQIVLPFRYLISRVKGHPTGRKYRIPIIHRLFQTSLLLDRIPYTFSTVLPAIGNDRPSVIFPGLDPVQFVSAPRAKLHFPQISGYRMKSEPLHIAMSIAIYFRSRIGLPYEGVPWYRLSIGRDVEYLPQ